MPLLSRPAVVLARASSFVLIIGLAACAGPEALPEDPTGRLFARSLDEISDLYIAPVSSNRQPSRPAKLRRRDAVSVC